MSVTTRDAQKYWKEQKRQIDELALEAQTLKGSFDEKIAQAESQTATIEGHLGRSAELKGQLDQLVTDSSGRLAELNSAIDSARQTETDTRTAFDNLNSDVESLRASAESLLAEQKTQQEIVAKLLKDATAAGLFAAFDKGKGEHAESAKFWGRAAFLAALSVATAAFFLASGPTQSITLSYFIRKFTILSPLIYWLVLSTKQFSKAKRLEEEYRFKSSISLSLEAYRDMLRKESEAVHTAEQVVPVLSSAVEKIFRAPSESIAKYPHKDDKDLIEIALETTRTIADAVPKVK